MMLRLVERALVAPRSPYRALFRAVGCELGDVRRLVARDGVEAMLRTIAAAGVYVTFDEFKGRVPIERGGEKARVTDEDFDNPVASADFSRPSGGTHGRPRRILADLDYVADTAPGWAAWFAAEGWLARPLVFATPIYPGIALRQLRCVRFGKPFEAWFSTGHGVSPGYRLVSAYLNWLIRWRAGVPTAERVALDDLGMVASRLSDLAAAGRPPCVCTSPSTAARIAVAAHAAGRSLAGVAFLLGAEPVTAARRRTIEISGARAVATYGTSEVGPIGVQCALAAKTDEVHLLLDQVAVVSRPRPIVTGDVVNALLITALLPSCPKLMLNVEIGDYGTLVDRSCGCRLAQLGYHRHLHTVRSFEKLTGEGATIHVIDLYRILEEALPQRFGGSSTDYQLVETETARGLPRYVLRVSPEVGGIDEPALVSALLEEVGRLRRPYPFMVDQWAQAGAVRVHRERPQPTERGKILPFLTLGHGSPT
jgi:hypothetical protein